MQLKEFIGDREAVSPVIGVILMVAITVILAAVIGTFVLGLGDQVGDTAPNANWDAEIDEPANGEYNVTFSHTGGDSVDAETLSIEADDDVFSGDDAYASVEVLSAGDSITREIDDGEDGEITFNLIWESGDQSTILDTETLDVPE
ncbi:flagellin [Halalkaliarchaeum desulfuricum]|uniref:Flagellin n=1 Tax=Halalkaliarchaeum desulfuricum TaxID=2055893 RepID=A0A343TNK7_9EURY|nr:type IV pilin N-terminal domain-containing protein [Halalkaliarchaeum desulfuricum]AUX10679.1 flagellin [Halalkaliarchaeum desulfuricum]